MLTNVQQFLKLQVVNFYTTHNPKIKVAVIERVNGILKAKMFKYLTKIKTYLYLEVIDKLLTSYKNSVQSTIGMPRAK
jgi:hypothetical protein